MHLCVERTLVGFTCWPDVLVRDACPPGHMRGHLRLWSDMNPDRNLAGMNTTFYPPLQMFEHV